MLVAKSSLIGSTRDSFVLSTNSTYKYRNAGKKPKFCGEHIEHKINKIVKQSNSNNKIDLEDISTNLSPFIEKGFFFCHFY